MVKTTLRIPDPVMDKLRERSRAERRSVNDLAIEALLRGLGGELDGDPVRILGPILFRAATEKYDAERMRAERRRLGLRGGDLMEDLNWTRGSE